MGKILIIDDERDVHYSFRRILGDENHEIFTAENAETGLKLVAENKPDVVLLDIRLGGANGIEALKKLRELDPKALVIMMTAYGTTQTAIETMKLGAYDYVLKPFDVPKIKSLIEQALRTARDMRQVVSYQPLLKAEDYAEGIVGKSPAMQEVFKLIGQVSQSDATVLITGESGTGKELVARAIYHHSQRAEKPFLAINCAAIPENLLEAELFGHEKGAFTGAVERRIGRFEQCDGGTIFLDEIGDMAPATQTKLLRVLQDGEFQRVGGTQTMKVNVRVLAATNKNPEELVAAGKFREDLYYRLNVVRIHLPPLRERREDIAILVDYFVHKLPKAKKISREVVKILQQREWQGNVRELQNVIERAAVVARSGVILPDDLPAETSKTAQISAKKAGETVEKSVEKLFALAKSDKKLKLMAAVERELIVRALEETGGNQAQAAKLLGMTRATLRKRIEKFGIRRKLDVK
jgi:nitrogen regulation protein NR(I)